MPDNPRIDELRRRVQRDPASIAFAQLAEEYRRAGDFSEAVEVCRAGLEKHPSYLSARVTLGRALIELERFEEAAAELGCVLRSAPENLAAIRGLAEIHQRRGDLGQALRQYQSALNIAKHDPELEESVTELSRQLGTPQAPPPPLPAESEIAAPVVEPPDIPFDIPLPPSLEVEPTAFAPVALEEITPVAPASTASPELAAAADEFTRALEALGALSFDLPAAPLESHTLDLPAAPTAVDHIEPPEPPAAAASLASEATVAEPAAPALTSTDRYDLEPELPVEPEAALPEPESVAALVPEPQPARENVILSKLEGWLDAILLDRASRATHRS